MKGCAIFFSPLLLLRFKYFMSLQNNPKFKKFRLMLIKDCFRRPLITKFRLSLSECMVVPDDWSAVHTRFIDDHSYGVLCRGVFVGGKIYEGYVICISGECFDRHINPLLPELNCIFYF